MPRYDEDELGDRRGLPVTEFLYTLDQVAHILNFSQNQLKTVVYFDGLIGRKQKTFNSKMIMAKNVIPSELHEEPEWRVPESEMVRYLESRNLIVYERRLQ